MYTIEQLWAWGNYYDDDGEKNMIPMITHHFFKQKEKKPAAGTRSPGKQIHYQSECMDQLDKWHQTQFDFQ